MEPTIDTTASEEIPADTTDEASSDLTMDGSALDSMEVAEDVKVSAYQVVPGEENKVSYEALSEETASITYMENTVDDDGSVNKESEKILFKVTPAKGKVLTKVEYALAENEEGLTAEPALKGATGAIGANTQYEIPDKVETLIKDKKVVGIYITTEEEKYTVKFAAGSNASGAKAYLKNAEGKYDFAGSNANQTEVKYSDRDSLTFAVTGLGETADEAKVTADNGSVSGGTAGTEGEVKYLEYTLTLSEAKGLSGGGTVTVTFDKTAAAAITLASADFVTGANVTVAKPDASLEAYKDHKELKADASYAAGDKIAFTATAKTNYKVVAPAAYWTVDEDAETENKLTVSSKEETVGENKVTVYEIDLAGITQDANLHVEIGAELDDEKDAVKTVSFTAENGHVKVTGTPVNKDLAGGSDKFETGTSYAFKVEPDDGYAVTKIEAVFTKTYADDTTKDETYTIGEDGNKLADDSDLYPFNSETAMTALFEGTDTVEEKSVKWTARKVELKITTEVETSVLEAEVTFESEGSYAADTAKGAYGVEVKTEEGKVEKKEGTEEDEEIYTVKPGTEYLEFAVTGAKSAPEVTVAGKAYEAEEGFTYRVPAVNLSEETKVVIKRKANDVRVNFNGVGSIATTVTDLDAEINAASGTPSKLPDGYDTQAAFTVNADANIKITGKMALGMKANIQKVTYRVGDEGADQEAEVKKDGTFEIRAEASDDVHVFVVKSTDKKIELTNVDYDIEDGVYHVKNYLTTINAKVYSGEAALPLFAASVKDGTKNAATKAVISKDDYSLAEIKVDSREFNKVLTVTLTTLEDRTPVTFQIKTDTPVASVAYASEEIQDGKLTLPVDTVFSTNVTMTADSAPIDNLDVAVIGAAETEIKDASVTGNASVETYFDDGVLTITTLPSGKDGAGKADAAKIVLYDKMNDNKIVEGSAIVLSTDKAVVLGENVIPDAKLSETNASSANSLRVEVKPVANLGKLPNVGSLYYKVDVDASGVSAANADIVSAIKAQVSSLRKYYPMEELDAAGGITLQVVPDVVKGEECVGAKAEGFGVKVTLVQTFDNMPAGDANIITGAVKDLGAASTKDPYFEDTKTGKLKVKNGTTTINTGDTNWISVAEPQFDKNADYTDVNVSFVDVKTGLPKTPYGMAVDYNAVTNKVVVRFNGKNNYYSYNTKSNTTYKDLGVKVTAKTQSTGYGVSGTVKLTVVNGIESISADAQPYALKIKDKVSTFKVAIDLNRSSYNNNKEYAPKKKNVDYEIVSAGTYLDEDGNTEADLINKAPAKAAAAITLKNGKTVAGVSVKNGTVTIAKEYELAKNAADNRFKVLVKANDYAGNTVVGLTEEIEITGQNRALGKLTVVKVGHHDNDEIGTPVTGSVAEVTHQDGCEYRAVLLKGDAELTSKGYYVLDYNNIVDPKEVNFTPAKGNVYVDEYGYIHVKKFGKASIVAADKSDKNNKTDKLNMEFKQTSSKLVLEITQMKDSTLETAVRPSFYSTDVKFSGNNVTYFGVNVVDDSEDHNKVALSDVKLGFKNLKNVTPKKDTDWRYGQQRFQYVVATTGKTGTITFNSKLCGKADYTLTNELTIDKNMKAPKFALTKGAKIVAGDSRLWSYTVSGAKTDNFEGKYVMLSVDDTKKNPQDITSVFNYGGQRYIDRALPIRNGSMLEIGVNAINAGNYNLVAAVGTLENGVFTQEYADAKIVVKVAKKGSLNLKVTGSYTLDPQVASTVKLQYNEKDGLAYFANDPDKDGNYAKNAIIDHKENKFNYYFEVKENDEYADEGVLGTIGLKNTLTKEEVDALVADPKSPDLTGFISVYNAGKQVDVKITIKFKSFAKSIKAVATPVLAGNDVTVDIALYNGKEYLPVKDYSLTVADSFEKAGLVNGPTNEKGEVLYGDIRLTSKTLTDGKKDITILATPANNTLYKDNKQADPVEVNVKLTVAKANLKNKAVITKGLDKWVVSSKDYVGPTEAHVAGAWKNDAITYSFKNRLSVKEGTKINVEWDAEKFPYVSLASDSYSVEKNLQTLTAELDKAKLVEAVASDKKLKWGGKITVSATLSYAGTAEDEAYNPGLEKDTVKLTITLPKTEPAASKTEADFKKLETSIQNMVETMSAYYQKLMPEDYAWYNEDIRSRIEGIVLDEANGATVDVNVDYTAENKGKEPEGQASVYTVTVKDIYTHDFTANPEMTVDTVWSRISRLSASNWAAAKTDAATKDFFLLDETTSTADYAAMIRNMLVAKGGLTNNISIRVDLLKDGLKAPTTKANGYYNVNVTLTDKSVAPNEKYTRKHTLTNSVYYNINAIETAGVVETRVKSALTNTDTIKELLGKAWEAVATPGAEFSDEETLKALEAKVAELILAKAKELVEADTNTSTANVNVTVKELKADEATEKTVALTIAGNQLTGIKYTLVLADSTEGAVKKEIEIAVNQSDLTVAPDNFQTIDQLKTEAAKINLIPNAADEEAVKEAVAKKIAELKKNPAIDLSKMVVTVVDGSFTAPEGDVDGIVSVKVNFTGKDDSETAISNIVILATGDDFEVENPDDEMTDEEIAEAKELARVKSAITAKLSVAALRKMIVDLKEETIDTNAVKGKIVELVNDVLPDTYADAVAADIDFGEATIETPADASTDYKLPAFTVKFKKSATGATEQNVEIAEKNLGKLAAFQSFDEAKAALTAWAKNTLTLGHIEGLAVDDSGIDNGFKDVTSLKAAVKSAIEEAEVVTNASFTVANEAESIEGDNKTTYKSGTGDIAYEVTNWKVTLTGVDESSRQAPTQDAYVDIKIMTEEATPAVKAVTFASVDDKKIAYGESGTITGEGSAAGTPVEIEVSGNKTTVEIKLNALDVTDGAKNDADYQAVTWAATDSTGNKLDEEIAISNDGTLNIPLTAAGTSAADRTKTVKVVATSVKPGVDGTNQVKSADLYIKLTFVPEVTDLTINGSDFIELDKDGNSGENITYTATMNGNHLFATDAESMLDWTTDGLGKDGVTGAEVTTVDGKTDKVTVKLASAKDLVGKQNLVVATKTGEDGLTEKAVTETKDITVRQFDDKNMPTIKLGEAEGVEIGTLGSDENTSKITVTGGEVKIPLSIDGDALENRTWTFEKSGSDVSSIDGIKIKPATKKSPAMLVIDNTVPAMADEVTEEGSVKTPAKKITLTATATASGAQTGVETTLTAALVIEKELTGVKLVKTSGESGSETEDTDDTGIGNISADFDDENGTAVVLATRFEGNHVTASEELAKMSYKLSRKTKNLNATLTSDNATGKVTVTIDKESMVRAGFVEVAATWTDGEGENKQTFTATRVIRLTDPKAARDIILANSEEGKTGDKITVADAEETLSQTYTITNLPEDTNVDWTAETKDAAISDKVAMDSATGALTLSGLKNWTAGVHTATVKAAWTENGVKYEKSLPVTITVKAVVNGIMVKVGDTELTEEGEGYKLELSAEQEGTVVLTPEAIGVRLTGNEKVTIKAEVTGTVNGFTLKANSDGTVTISASNADEGTSRENCTATFTIEATTEEDTGLTAVPEEVTKTVTITAAAAEESA